MEDPSLDAGASDYLTDDLKTLQETASMKETFGTDAYDHIQDDLNWFEKLGRKIPGFKGYFEQRDRREADQLLRQTLVDRFEQVRLRFAQVHEAVVGDIILAIDLAEPLGRVDTKLMGLIGKINDAPQGYSSFFNPVKVDTEKLEQLYQFDYQMMVHGEEIATAVEALVTAADNGDDLKPLIRQVDKEVKEANTAFASRQEVLTGMG